MTTTSLEPSEVSLDPRAETIVEAILHGPGYCVTPEVLSQEELSEIHGALDAIREREWNEKVGESKQQRCFAISVKHPCFRRLMSHPLVVQVWRKLLGSDMICSTWSSNTILGGHGRYGWHADYPYWSMAEPWPSGLLAGQTLWLLDDFTAENGATGLVPNSHLKNCRPNGDSTQARSDETLLIAKAGSLLMFDGRLWHSSRPNSTDKPRSALLGMYARSCIVPMEDMSAQLPYLSDVTPDEEFLFCAKKYKAKVNGLDGRVSEGY